MIQLPGVISDKLRRLFGLDVGDWPAARADDAIRDMPADAYRGIDFTRPGRRGQPRE